VSNDREGTSTTTSSPRYEGVRIVPKPRTRQPRAICLLPSYSHADIVHAASSTAIYIHSFISRHLEHAYRVFSRQNWVRAGINRARREASITQIPNCRIRWQRLGQLGQHKLCLCHVNTVAQRRRHQIYRLFVLYGDGTKAINDYPPTSCQEIIPRRLKMECRTSSYGTLNVSIIKYGTPIQFIK
jgi:hypothetical protein